MDCSRKQKILKVEIDRLSNLPEELIHKILSFMSTKHVVQTSALSSRWKYTWTSMPCLDFSSNDFAELLIFSKFVTHVLSGRNNEFLSCTLKSLQPSPFVNLKNMLIYPSKVEKWGFPRAKLTATKVKKNLLDGCSGVNITMVSREETAARRNATRAKKPYNRLTGVSRGRES
ncbi:F-box/FBD/LRR-repeat protein At1g16930-like isoform X2 [Rutidosis leptorrhynchoides]